jgi:hypothetical protein
MCSVSSLFSRTDIDNPNNHIHMNITVRQRVTKEIQNTPNIRNIGSIINLIMSIFVRFFW